MKTLIISLLLLLTVNAQTYRKAVLLHHSTGNRIYQYTVTDAEYTGAEVESEVVSYNTAKGYTGSDTVSFDERWWPIPPQGNFWWIWHYIMDGNDPTEPIDDFWALCDTFDVIVIKNGLDEVTGVDSASYWLNTIFNIKYHLREIVTMLEAHPNTFFVIWPIAPKTDFYVTAEEAGWANWVNVWARDTLQAGLDSYGTFPDNVYIWDMMSRIEDENHYESLYYAKSAEDDHPNENAADTLAPLFVNEIFDAAIAYENRGKWLRSSNGRRIFLSDGKSIIMADE